MAVLEPMLQPDASLVDTQDMPRRLPRTAPVVVVAALLSAVAGCASGLPTGATPAPFPNAPGRPWDGPAGGPSLAAVEPMLELATSLRGVRYRYGGDQPSDGFDCSGFVRYVFGQFAVDVPRTAAEQFRAGHRVASNQLAAGDLVFFSTIGPGPTHVGIVVDPTVQTFVHAPGTGSAVRIERFDTPYWRRRMVGIRRLVLPAGESEQVRGSWREAAQGSTGAVN